jgi:phenylalanyl-tRNA synthetase alpha chain
MSKSKKNKNSQQTISSKLQSFLDEADRIKKQLRQETLNRNELEQKYLGKKGLFTQLSAKITDIPKTDKPQAGKVLNHLKEDITGYIEKLSGDESQLGLDGNFIDLTLPGKEPQMGHLHPITQAIDEITDIFQKIGFIRVRYPEVDWDWYAFGSLNMPQDHPARDEWETFFVDESAHSKKGKMVLTPHTSNGQVREMERVGEPPIRMINIARCYRRQQDVTHTQMFHQFEGLVIDKDINIQHLKGTIDHFAKEFYGPSAKSRIRPFHFKFTEPSFEVDFSCHICEGKGIITDPNDPKKTTTCRFCKSGWHEVGGAGMVHPNVLKAGGIDPNEYTGFAFGWGIERSYTLKKGLNIDDIRLLYSAQMEFLQQF